MVTLLYVAVMVLLLTIAFGVGWIFDLRVRSLRQDDELRKLLGAAAHLPVGVHIEMPMSGMPAAATASSPSAPGEALDIPAALVGARWKEAIERLAPVLDMTPVDLLRAAIDIGLSGGRSITSEMLDMIDKLVEEANEADAEEPSSKPDPKDQH